MKIIVSIKPAENKVIFEDILTPIQLHSTDMMHGNNKGDQIKYRRQEYS